MISLLALTSDARKTISGLSWYVRGKRLRGKNIIKLAAFSHPKFYNFWVRKNDYIDVKNQVYKNRDNNVDIYIINFSENSVSCIESLNNYFDMSAISSMGFIEQVYYISELYNNKNKKCYFLFKCDKDILSLNYLDLINIYIVNNDYADIFYWDDDIIDNFGNRSDPWLKPDWNKLHFISQDYLSRSCLIKSSCLVSAMSKYSKCDDYRKLNGALFALLFSPSTRAPVHVPHTLSHKKERHCVANRDRLAFLAHHLPYSSYLRVNSNNTITYSPALPIPAPKVSILIPTRNKTNLLRSCIDGVIGTKYEGQIEIIIIDNDSDDVSTRVYLDDVQKYGIKILNFPGKFNFSSINNAGASLASGDLLCLLNNDIEVVNADWLSIMVRYAMEPDVGAVGAKLLYPDKTIQHAGLVIGVGGAAGHMHRHEPLDSVGYHNLPSVTRYVSAVTAACMVVRKDKYFAVGGLDERSFAVAFNDVDFCLKLDSMGYNNVYASDAILVHHESKTRGDDLSPENLPRFLTELEALQSRWKTKNYIDRYFHPRLSRLTEKYMLDYA